MGINWLEWSEEAFEKAKRENKPVLLDIHGVWCHWCHVMQDTTYSDEIVIETVNEKFIPIKVDTDKRPDINERYNQGGWPTTAFLTPEGAVISGATYVPAAQFAGMLEQVSSYYKRKKDDIKLELPAKIHNKGEIKSVLDEVMNEISVSFDNDYGGFGVQPKFPFPDAISLALLAYRKTGNIAFLKIVTKTLDGMAALSDPVEGGFYRYSVSRDWSEPHYEKMLDTNAQLIPVYMSAFLATGDTRYKEIAFRTADYILATLHGKEGFYASQDAGPESEYYGKSSEERGRMKKPYVDKTVYTNLNALAISTLLSLREEKYKNIALDAIDATLARYYNKEKGMAHCPGVWLFADNMLFIKCLLDAYEATGYIEHLGWARHLMDLAIKNFFDCGFADCPGGIGLLGVKNTNINENSLAARCLIHLSFATGKKEYADIAKETLEIFSKDYHKFNIHAAGYAIAVETCLDPIEVKVPSLIKAPTDPRVVIYYGNEITICRNKTCNRFEMVREAVEFLEILK